MQEFRQKLKPEIEKIKGLHGKERLEYIWGYYWIPIVALASLLFMIVYILGMLHNSVSDHWLYVAYVNTTEDLGTNSDLWNRYVDYTGYDLNRALVEFNSDIYFDYLDNGASGNKYYQLFVTYIEAGTLDAAVMETDQLVAFGATGRFLSLNDDSCKKIMEKYGDRLIYATPNDETYGTDPIPVGIDITDSILESEYDIYPEGTTYALGIGEFSQNQEAILKFLDMILE